MPSNLRCLDAETLTRLQRGEVTIQDVDTLGEHLIHCQRCAQAAGVLQGNDSLTVAIRAGAILTDETDRTRIDELIEEMRGLASPGPEGGVESLPTYDFLAPAQQPDEIGRLGPYRVLSVLGEGGMGVVFRAEDEQLRRLIALKVMKPALAANPSARRRFLREGQTTAALEHEHVVSIYQVGEDRGVPFLAMPLLKGESLEERLGCTELLPLAVVLRIGREIAAGLAAAHAHGLIHRDIKPANVWLETVGHVSNVPFSPGRWEPGPTTRVQLLDFGLARPVFDDAHLTQEGIVAGTPHYMAPEQAEGKAVDHRGDLFGLGCVLYRLATGKLPFPGANTLAVFRALAVQRPKPPREINPAVPRALSDLTMKLLAREPEDRPSSAAAVVEALAAIERGPTASRSRRHRLLTVAAALLFLGTLAGFATLFLRTPDGTLIVQIDDPGVEVTVEADGGLAITGAGIQKVRLRPGSYRWQATKDGKPVKSDIVTITRGDKQVVRVTLDPAAVPSAFTSPPLGSLDRLDPARIPAEERFAWQPQELVRVLGEHRGRHWGEAYSAAFRPDGKVIASGGSDGVIRLWDAETLREQAVLTGHRGSVLSVTFSPDGQFLLSAGEDRTLWRWDVATGKQLRRFDGHTSSVNGAALSADGRHALSGGGDGDNSVRLWDLETGEQLLRCTGHTAGVYSVALSADGLRALSGGNDRTARLWDLKTGKELLSFPGHTDLVRAVALSPDGRLALSGGGPNDSTVRLWEVETGRELHAFAGHTRTVNSVAFSPDGRRALSGGGGGDLTCRLWDVDSGKELRRLDRAGGWSTAFSPDGRRAVSAYAGLRLWDLETRTELCPQQGHPGLARSVAFSPDGRHLLSCSDWDMTVRLWDVESGQEVRHLEGHTDVVHSVAFSPDGRQALSGGQDEVMRLWDVTTGHELHRFGGRMWINSVAFSPDGRFALCSGGNGARLWDLSSKREVRQFIDPEHKTWSAAFSHDGSRVLTARQPDTVLVWDVDSGEVLHRFSSPEAGHYGVIVAPDGRAAFSAGSNGTLRRWDLDATEPRHRTFFKWHTDHVRGLAVAPDGKMLASSGEDGRVILWEAATGTKLREWQLPGRVQGVAFAPDGRHLATANGNGTVYVLRLAVPEPTPPK
jgi:WD40 repeat protein/serine/threonine protein kinase